LELLKLHILEDGITSLYQQYVIYILELVMKNIVYQTKMLSKYYSTERITWSQFYPSEKKLLEIIGLHSKHTILDIGCGCGGLGLALSEKFFLTNYVGVDINSEAVRLGKQLNPSASLICGDILDLTNGELSNQSFDTVISLSCIDYNIRFSEMLDVAWSHVAPGGQFVATFRLCLDDGINDISLSYQHINFENIPEGEIAPYVILNFWELLQLLEKFSPSEIKASGYWAPPSGSAVTPYKSVCFAALSISKKLIPDDAPVLYSLDLPPEFIVPIKK